ncbi:MAG TPA: alanine--tRNA ligase, partial [Oceanithermus sp.]|nr:alanine--tRNA ligase [Oceanithermus sp.]
KIELLVNRWIQADFPVRWELMPLEEARKAGAMALFGEKYADVVRVVKVEGAAPSAGIVEGEVRSMELCGGCHVRRTGEIGYFLIKSEEGISAGVRRIEALAGEHAVRYARGLFDRVAALAAELGATPEGLPERVEKLREELKAQGREIDRLKAELARAQLGGPRGAEVKEAGPWRYAAVRLSGLDMPGLRKAADALLEESGADLVAVGSEGMLVLKASKRAAERGLSAGALMRALAEVAGGRGGGKPQLAQGGGFDLEKAFERLADLLAGQPEV